MNKEEFKKKYGKIKVLDKIIERHPITNIKISDPNRELMIKFKYGNLTTQEQNQFHQNIKKLVYKVMHSNNIMMEWDDIYQEIGKKIIKFRHTWNENKGTMVSTWITIVANSVINTLRLNVNKYNSYCCLYDDIFTGMPENEQDSGNDKADLIQNQNENILLNKEQELNFWKEKYKEFLEELDSRELIVMKAIQQKQDKFIRTFQRNVRMPFNVVRKELGLNDSEFNIILYNIRKKYSIMFNKKFKIENKKDKNRKNNYLF